jgi:hypothetical protein
MKLELINESSVAYRNESASSIDIAREVIESSYKDDFYIVKGDFKGFFDNLNQKSLAKKIDIVLQGRVAPGTEEREAWNKVLKNFKKFKRINEKDLPEPKFDKKGGFWFFFDTPHKFREYVGGHPEIIKTIEKGIPQGNALSGVMANIYSIDFDRFVNTLIQPYGGFYRRYSDDFVILIPQKSISEPQILELKERAIGFSSKKLKLQIESNKTKLFRTQKDSRSVQKYIVDKKAWKASSFDYLGFVFDGRNVMLRPKTIYKFQTRSKKALLRLMTAQERRIVEVDKEKKSGRYEAEKAAKISIVVLYVAERHVRNKNSRLVLYRESFVDYAYRAQYKFEDGKVIPKENILISKQMNRIRRHTQFGIRH